MFQMSRAVAFLYKGLSAIIIIILKNQIIMEKPLKKSSQTCP